MKLNISYDKHGTVKAFEIKEDQVRRGGVLGKRLGAEVDGSAFGEVFAGYSFKLRGGQDDGGFPMMYGVCAPARVSLLLKRGACGYNAFRGRNGERRRKAVRGDIVGEDISVLNMSIVRVGEQPLEGVTDVSRPRALGPKRVSKIRALWNMDVDQSKKGNNKEDDKVRAGIRKFVIKRKVEKDGKKCRYKVPKVQRLITSSIRARRCKKVKTAKAAMAKNAAARREYLASITSDRLKQRQRRAARNARKAFAESKQVAGKSSRKNSKK